jgi:hypothetical protein
MSTNADRAKLWAQRLIAAAKADLALRAQLATSGALFEGYNPEMEALHLTNASLLEAFMGEHGWPSRTVLGEEAAAAAMLILQHAISRPDLQRGALGLLAAAAEAGEASPVDAAYLADRIAVLEGKPQLFGSQFDWDESGALSPAPILDPDSVDERRAQLGLPPIGETIAAMRARAAAEGDAPPSDMAARRAAQAAFLARVGWR